MRSPSFTWQAVGDGESCDDCLRRHGKRATFAQWSAWGLPGSGFSACRANCRCQLHGAGGVQENPPTSQFDQVSEVWDSPQVQSWLDTATARAAQTQNRLLMGNQFGKSAAEIRAIWTRDPGRVIQPWRAGMWRAAAAAHRSG